MPPTPEPGPSPAHLGRLELLWSYGRQPPLERYSPEWRAEQMRPYQQPPKAWKVIGPVLVVVGLTIAPILTVLLAIIVVVVAVVISTVVAVRAAIILFESGWLEDLVFRLIVLLIRLPIGLPLSLFRALRAAFQATVNLTLVRASIRARASLADPVKELDQFGEKIARHLPAEARLRYFDPYLQDTKCNLNDEIAGYDGPDCTAFVRRRLRHAEIHLTMAMLDSLRLAATDWVRGVIRRS
jgi:hypothetical protein